MNLNEIKTEEFLQFLGTNDFIFETPVPTISSDVLERAKLNINKIIENVSNRKLCILGIDTYKYSLRPIEEQILIPLILKDSFEKTKDVLSSNESFLFGSNDQIFIPYIDQGDGGFFIFQTPLHGITFAIWFECILRFYNTYHFNNILRSLIGSISVRYALTFDSIISIQNNYYGPAIINCARILSKDRLNRFLLDKNVIEWFLKNFNGIEMLQYISTSEIEKIAKKAFNETLYLESKFSNSIFSLFKDKHYGIKSCDVLQIGEIETKDRAISIYNLHMQVLAGMIPKDNSKEQVKITATLGNLNSEGLNSN